MVVCWKKVAYQHQLVQLHSDVDVVLVCHGKEKAKPKVQDFGLLVHLHSYPH